MYKNLFYISEVQRDCESTFAITCKRLHVQVMYLILYNCHLPGCYSWKDWCENCLCEKKPSNAKSTSQQKAITHLLWGVISEVYSVK